MKNMKLLTIVTVAAAVALSGCMTNAAGERQVSKTALYGLGGAVTCGIIGKATHGNTGARNSALVVNCSSLMGPALLFGSIVPNGRAYMHFLTWHEVKLRSGVRIIWYYRPTR